MLKLFPNEMDLTNPKILKFKGILFLILGILSGGLILLKAPEWEVVVLLLIFAWSFSRFYYFAFYVLQHYADPDFRYAGLLDLLKYLVRGKKE